MLLMAQSGPAGSEIWAAREVVAVDTEQKGKTYPKRPDAKQIIQNPI